MPFDKQGTLDISKFEQWGKDPSFVGLGGKLNQQGNTERRIECPIIADV